MTIDYPCLAHRQALRRLWQEAFGDDGAFLDHFYAAAYSPDRCRCVLEGGEPVAVLYWLDCELEGRKLAYLYAVTTAAPFRGRGICRRLMEDTHALLRQRGYAGAVLVPGEPELFAYYANLGYTVCSGVEEAVFQAADTPAPMRKVTPAEYGALRRTYLPAGGVVQEGENLAFLGTIASLYAGPDFLLASGRDESGTFTGLELLGRRAAAAGILKALGEDSGWFRFPGTEREFAMFLPLREDCPAPSYFGLAFD